MTQRYNAILLGALRAATASGQLKPYEAIDTIVDHIMGPAPEPSPQETRWLNALKARIDAELGDDDDGRHAGLPDEEPPSPAQMSSQPKPSPRPVATPRAQAAPKKPPAPWVEEAELPDEDNPEYRNC